MSCATTSKAATMHHQAAPPPLPRQPSCATKLHLHHLQGSHHASPSFSSRHAYTVSTTVCQQRPPSYISTTSNVQLLMHLQRALPCTTYLHYKPPSSSQNPSSNINQNSTPSLACHLAAPPWRHAPRHH